MGSILTALGLAGITYIITGSFLLEKYRGRVPEGMLRYMVNCPQCMGFWVGLLYWVVFGITSWQVILAPVYGGLISLLSVSFASVIEFFQHAKLYVVSKISEEALDGFDKIGKED